MKDILLETGRLILKPISLADLEKVHALQSSEEVNRFNTADLPKDVEETKMTIESWMENSHGFIFTVSSINHVFMGLIGINLGREKYRNAEVWFKLDPSYWNQGHGTEALKRIIAFGFKELGLHRIEAGCAVDNVGSFKVLEKAGMLREAHTRQLLPLRSGWADNYGYAILSTD